MNSYSWSARGMVCVAAISCIASATACEAHDPNTEGLKTWAEIVSNTPADMAEVQGNTFGLSDWRQGKTQGIFGVALLGNCVVTISPGTLSHPDKFNVEVETLDKQYADPAMDQSIDDIQYVIDRNREICQR